MPIYEYRRQDGSTFEVIQKFLDDALTIDPETGEPVERVYSAPAIHFKGSGFHNTDYGSRRRAKADSGDSGEGGSSSSTSETAGKTPEKPPSEPKPASASGSSKSDAPASSASKTSE